MNEQANPNAEPWVKTCSGLMINEIIKEMSVWRKPATNHGSARSKTEYYRHKGGLKVLCNYQNVCRQKVVCNILPKGVNTKDGIHFLYILSQLNRVAPACKMYSLGTCPDTNLEQKRFGTLDFTKPSQYIFVCWCRTIFCFNYEYQRPIFLGRFDCG